MQRIHYADESVLTGTDIAQGLLRYAAALARRGSSATVDVPIRTAEGAIDRASFLLGPASQMVATNETSPFDELEDIALVAAFDRETEKLGNPRALASEQPPASARADPDLDSDADHRR